LASISHHDIGGWIFQRRTWLPLVFLPILLLPLPWHHNPVIQIATGIPLMVLGETIRLLSVGYAGRITRTRSGALGPLVVAGPYRLVRNPLYIGNMLIAAGAICLAGRFLVLPLVLVGVAYYYDAVVHWEERLLASVFGEEYAEYCRRTPRWWVARTPCPRMSLHRFNLSEAVQSERGTLGTLTAICLGVWLLEWLTHSGIAPWLGGLDLV
jgi:protein-S-isoprenylcysteine O-methyltransferase Ste14